MAEWKFALTGKEMNEAVVLYCAKNRALTIPDGQIQTALERCGEAWVLTITHPIPPPTPPKPFRWFWQKAKPA